MLGLLAWCDLGSLISDWRVACQPYDRWRDTVCAQALSHPFPWVRVVGVSLTHALYIINTYVSTLFRYFVNKWHDPHLEKNKQGSKQNILIINQHIFVFYFCCSSKPHKSEVPGLYKTRVGGTPQGITMALSVYLFSISLYKYL